MCNPASGVLRIRRRIGALSGGNVLYPERVCVTKRVAFSVSGEQLCITCVTKHVAFSLSGGTLCILVCRSNMVDCHLSPRTCRRSSGILIEIMFSEGGSL